jgi:hypothetical protein
MNGHKVTLSQSNTYVVSGQVFSQYLEKESMVGVLNGFGAKGWPGLLDVMCRR